MPQLMSKSSAQMYFRPCGEYFKSKKNVTNYLVIQILLYFPANKCSQNLIHFYSGACFRLILANSCNRQSRFKQRIRKTFICSLEALLFSNTEHSSHPLSCINICNSQRSYPQNTEGRSISNLILYSVITIFNLTLLLGGPY